MITDLGLFVALLAISVVDLRTRRIPDLMSLPLICVGLGLAVQAVRCGASSDILTDSIIGAAAGYLLFAAVGAAFFRLRGREGLGLGDAKLLSAAGAWLGWQMLPTVVLIAAVAGLVQAAIVGLVAPHKATDRSLAFGPWLALAFFSLWMLSP